MIRSSEVLVRQRLTGLAPPSSLRVLLLSQLRPCSSRRVYHRRALARRSSPSLERSFRLSSLSLGDTSNLMQNQPGPHPICGQSSRNSKRRLSCLLHPLLNDVVHWSGPGGRGSTDRPPATALALATPRFGRSRTVLSSSAMTSVQVKGTIGGIWVLTTMSDGRDFRE